ncbi:hypothetical protein [Winogradskyella helgolandensis]|uniref:hypothetical protein n=1 Tax=Winogradskyella helgolandensis TaxID=2697010 RepID=UPI0015CEDD05|nr:hypothetical protein [Winogradskyella helgolandensis]
MRATKILLLIFILSFSSCYTTKRLIRENDFETSGFNNQSINGIYSNGLNDSIPKNLWVKLKSSYTDKTDTINLDINNNVKLTMLNSENLKIQLLDKTGKSVIDEFDLKGRIKGNFFTIDRKLTLYPFIPVYYVNMETKTILGNDLNGNLVLVTGSVNEAMILMVAGGNRHVQNHKFNRIKN